MSAIIFSSIKSPLQKITLSRAKMNRTQVDISSLDVEEGDSKSDQTDSEVCVLPTDVFYEIGRVLFEDERIEAKSMSLHTLKQLVRLMLHVRD